MHTNVSETQIPQVMQPTYSLDVVPCDFLFPELN
jgi:hypothetical protein